MEPQLENEKYDMTSVGVVAVVSIICVVLMVISLSPREGGDLASETDIPANVAGAADYDSACIPITNQLDFSSLDLNGDSRLDYYDYQDVLSGKVDCSKKDCDLNDDGYLDGLDATAFNLLIVRVYDYDNDRKLTREDPRRLAALMLGKGDFNKNHIYDVDGDGLLCKSDITLYTSLLYNYDNAQ